MKRATELRQISEQHDEAGMERTLDILETFLLEEARKGKYFYETCALARELLKPSAIEHLIADLSPRQVSLCTRLRLLGYVLNFREVPETKDHFGVTKDSYVVVRISWDNATA